MQIIYYTGIMKMTLFAVAGFLLFASAIAAEETGSFDLNSLTSINAINDFKSAASSKGLFPSPATPAPFAATAVPLVITVPGVDFGEIGEGLFELKHLIKIWKLLFPGHPVNEQELAVRLKAINEAEGRGVTESREENNFFEQCIRKAAARNGINVEIVSFLWSHDPDISGIAVRDLKNLLCQVNIYAIKTRRPIYIVAHSWGSVLVHQSLIELAKEGNTVEVAKLITMGSPLVPEHLWMKAFDYIMFVRQHLQRLVVKPAGLKYWVNMYSKRDLLSSRINVADENIRVDYEADIYEAELMNLLKMSPAIVRHDLRHLKNSPAWHRAYYNGFKTEFVSLNQTMDLDPLQENINNIFPMPNSTTLPVKENGQLDPANDLYEVINP